MRRPRNSSRFPGLFPSSKRKMRIKNLGGSSRGLRLHLHRTILPRKTPTALEVLHISDPRGGRMAVQGITLLDGIPRAHPGAPAPGDPPRAHPGAIATSQSQRQPVPTRRSFPATSARGNKVAAARSSSTSIRTWRRPQRLTRPMCSDLPRLGSPLRHHRSGLTTTWSSRHPGTIMIMSPHCPSAWRACPPLYRLRQCNVRPWWRTLRRTMIGPSTPTNTTRKDGACVILTSGCGRRKCLARSGKF